jgi:heme-degrading monooxygenase HmoA
MFIVLFEVEPKESEWDRYLELAGKLRPELEAVPGFIEMSATKANKPRAVSFPSQPGRAKRL